ASFFGGADPVVMQVVIGRTHGRRVPAQFYGATPNSSRLNSDGLAPHPGCRTSATSLPGGRRPEKPPATSGYPLATLRVDPFRMSKLQSLPKQERRTALRVGDTEGARRSSGAPSSWNSQHRTPNIQ